MPFFDYAHEINVTSTMPSDWITNGYIVPNDGMLIFYARRGDSEGSVTYYVNGAQAGLICLPNVGSTTIWGETKIPVRKNDVVTAIVSGAAAYEWQILFVPCY